jgi:hypothetical protein
MAGQNANRRGSEGDAAALGVSVSAVGGTPNIQTPLIEQAPLVKYDAEHSVAANTPGTGAAQAAVGYHALKAMAAELRRPLSSLFVLTDDNDPYLADRPGRRKTGGQWFASLWDRLEVPDGVHLRRLHYLIVSVTGIVLPNGKPYENTHKCWKSLGRCSADARFGNLVPAEAFVDRRAPEPIIYVPGDTDSGASIAIDDAELTINGAGAEAPDLDYVPATYDFPGLPGVIFSAPKLAEPYAIEIWVEKSTVNDILLPLARAHGVTLVTGVGELSITACLALARRVREHRRPTRILYLSDFDPAGQGMPTSVARKVQFFLDRDGDDLDIRLHPILLTAEQVAEFDLPRVPIKETDRRRGAFEDRHGEGAVELDALVALRPGEIERIVRRAIDWYRAPTRRARQAIARREIEIRREIAEIRQGVIDAHADEIAGLRSSFENAQADIEERQSAIGEVIAEAQAAVAEHEQAIDERLEQWRAEAAPVWETIANELEEAAPDLDAVEWPEPEPPDEPEPLYDSQRNYLDQVASFKAYQGKAAPAVLNEEVQP